MKRRHQKPASAPKIGEDDQPPGEPGGRALRPARTLDGAIPPGVLRPGGLMEEAEPEEEEDDHPPLAPEYAHATYAAEEDPEKCWDRENLCGRCYHRRVCKHRPDPDLLIVIRRCIAFSPTTE